MTNDDDGMGGHNLRCGEDDEEDDDDFYGTKVAKGISFLSKLLIIVMFSKIEIKMIPFISIMLFFL